MNRVMVHLTNEERDEADHEAHLRMENVRLLNRVGGRPADPVKDLQIHILAARCERAAMIYFPLEWHARFSNTKAFETDPDLGDFIDVKGVEEHSRGLLSPKFKPDRKTLAVVDDWAYVKVSAQEHPYYWIAGWLWGCELAQECNLAFPHRPGYLVKQDGLHHPEILLQIVINRK